MSNSLKFKIKYFDFFKNVEVDDMRNNTIHMFDDMSCKDALEQDFGWCSKCFHSYENIFFHNSSMCKYCQESQKRPKVINFETINQTQQESLSDADKLHQSLVPIQKIFSMNQFIKIDKLTLKINEGKYKNLKLSDILIEILENNSCKTLDLVLYSNGHNNFLMTTNNIELLCLQILQCQGKNGIQQIQNSCPKMFDRADYEYLMKSYVIPEGLDFKYSIWAKIQNQDKFKNIDLDKEYEDAKFQDGLSKQFELNTKFDLKMVVGFYDNFMENCLFNIEDEQDLFQAESKNLIQTFKIINENMLLDRIKEKQQKQKVQFDQIQLQCEDWMELMNEFLKENGHYKDSQKDQRNKQKLKNKNLGIYFPISFTICPNIFKLKIIQSFEDYDQLSEFLINNVRSNKIVQEMRDIK